MKTLKFVLVSFRNMLPRCVFAVWTCWRRRMAALWQWVNLPLPLFHHIMKLWFTIPNRIPPRCPPNSLLWLLALFRSNKTTIAAICRKYSGTQGLGWSPVLRGTSDLSLELIKAPFPGAAASANCFCSPSIAFYPQRPKFATICPYLSSKLTPPCDTFTLPAACLYPSFVCSVSFILFSIAHHNGRSPGHVIPKKKKSHLEDCLEFLQACLLVSLCSAAPSPKSP